MAKEYIEREAAVALLEQKLRDICPLGRCSRNAVYGTDRDLYDAIESDIDALNNIPAADVVEVVHGRWEWREEWDTDEVAHTATLKSCGWYCTECGIELGDYLTKETGERHFIDDDFFTPCLKHCPNCGARMRGAEDE